MTELKSYIQEFKRNKTMHICLHIRKGGKTIIEIYKPYSFKIWGIKGNIPQNTWAIISFQNKNVDNNRILDYKVQKIKEKEDTYFFSIIKKYFRNNEQLLENIIYEVLVKVFGMKGGDQIEYELVVARF